MKYLIVGLGNIGSEYAETRHNIGFKLADALVAELGGTFESKRYGQVAEVKYKGRILIVLKPNTYMNLSGKAVNYWLKETKLEPDHLMVMLDDLALPFGQIRIRAKGSDGGHNGLKDIQTNLGHNNYPRLRFGISDEETEDEKLDGKVAKEVKAGYKLNGKVIIPARVIVYKLKN
jgi:PTH1 family peptidyl-tRNA hydrolase